jgi:hypothetical protein
MVHEQGASAAGPGPTAAPPPAPTLEMMREKMQNIKQLVLEVNILACEISGQVAALEESVFRESGGSQSLQ